MTIKTIFLDRDGVINKEVKYLFNQRSILVSSSKVVTFIFFNKTIILLVKVLVM